MSAECAEGGGVGPNVRRWHTGKAPQRLPFNNIPGGEVGPRHAIYVVWRRNWKQRHLKVVTALLPPGLHAFYIISWGEKDGEGDALLRFTWMPYIWY
jgi:uncharacterized protein YfaP (DUF2135 family)